MSFRQLCSLINKRGPTIEQPTKDQWSAFEAKNFCLPDDYKKFLCHFGSGILADFFVIWNPFSKIEGFEWFKESKQTLNVYCEAIMDSPELYGKMKLFPDPGGLLPCGRTMNGDSI